MEMVLGVEDEVRDFIVSLKISSSEGLFSYNHLRRTPRLAIYLVIEYNQISIGVLTPTRVPSSWKRKIHDPKNLRKCGVKTPNVGHQNYGKHSGTTLPGRWRLSVDMYHASKSVVFESFEPEFWSPDDGFPAQGIFPTCAVHNLEVRHSCLSWIDAIGRH